MSHEQSLIILICCGLLLLAVILLGFWFKFTVDSLYSRIHRLDNVLALHLSLSGYEKGLGGSGYVELLSETLIPGCQKPQRDYSLVPEPLRKQVEQSG